jgi:hypothetical protein
MLACNSATQTPRAESASCADVDAREYDARITELDVVIECTATLRRLRWWPTMAGRERKTTISHGAASPAGMLLPKGCFSRRAASPGGLLRWLAGSLAAAARRAASLAGSLAAAYRIHFQAL